MQLQQNRRLRKYWVFRRFILDPRKVAFRRREIVSLILSVANRLISKQQPVLKRRCKKIAKFVLIEERIERQKKNIEISFVLFSTTIQLVIIPLFVYIYYFSQISSGWLYWTGFISLIVVLPLLLILPKFLFSKFAGIEFQANPKRQSIFIALVSLIFVLAKLFSDFELQPWIWAGSLTYSFFIIHDWILTPVIIFLYTLLPKRTHRSYPREKAIHILAVLSYDLSKSMIKGRIGSIEKKKRISSNLDTLATIFEKHYHKPYKIDNIETRNEFKKRCNAIAMYWRTIKMDVYFTRENSISILEENFNDAFISIWEDNLGNIKTHISTIDLKKSIREYIKKIAPSFTLLLVWSIVYFLCEKNIPNNYSTTLWLIFSSLPISTSLQYFDQDLSKGFSIINNLKTIFNKTDNKQ